MTKTTKSAIFVATAACNIIFFLICGYGKIQQPDTASFLEPFLGVLAVAVLAYGETRLVIQIYFKSKYSSLEIRRFDGKFWRQCILFTAYYIGCLVYLAVALHEYSASYLSIFALAFSPFWMTGSRTLWTGDVGENSYYLDELGTWYEVSKVMENSEVVEITCAAPGDRERTITIAKKKQELAQ